MGRAKSGRGVKSEGMSGAKTGQTYKERRPAGGAEKAAQTKEGRKKAAVSGGEQEGSLLPLPPGIFGLFPAEAVASAGTQ